MLRRNALVRVFAVLMLPFAASASPARADGRTACADELARLQRGRPLGLTLANSGEIRGRFESLDSETHTVCVTAPDSTLQCYELSEVKAIHVWERGHLSAGGILGGLVGGAVLGAIVGTAFANSSGRNGSELSDFGGLSIFAGLVIGSAGGLVLGAIVPPLCLSEQVAICAEQSIAR